MAQISSGVTQTLKNTGQSRYTLQLTIIGILFFFFGFVTNANDLLIPYLKKACQLTDFQSAFVQFAFFGAYFFMAIPSAYIIRKLGYRKSIVAGLVICALGALLFLPAAQTRFYLFFLGALSILASGVTLLQTAANPYVSILGPMESAPTRINIMGVCNNTAGFLAPLIFGSLLLTGANLTHVQLDNLTPSQLNAYLDAEAAKVIVPYILLAGILLLVAALVYFSRLPEIEDEQSDDKLTIGGQQTSSVFQHRNLVLGIAAVFFYVAAEVAVGSFIIRYGQSLGIAGFTEQYGSNFVSAYWGLTCVARFAGIFVVGKLVKPHNALVCNAIGAIALLLFSYATFGLTALVAVVAIGICNSIMWPVIFPMAINGLGRFTKIGSSFLIMAIVGGALFPPLVGYLSDLSGIKTAYLANIVCYAYLIFYGVRGYKPTVR
jgi:glucose/galactose transporter